MNPTATTFSRRAAQFGAHVDAAADIPEAPTPCADWTVRDLVRHVIETERDFLLARGLDPGPAPETGDVAADWHTHAARVGALLTDDVADREYEGYFGRTTIAATMADFYGWDLLVHGWDLASASGRSWTPTEEEVEWLRHTADGFGEALYSEGICRGPVPVPDDAPPADQLLGMLGRDPGWSPPPA